MTGKLLALHSKISMLHFPPIVFCRGLTFHDITRINDKQPSSLRKRNLLECLGKGVYERCGGGGGRDSI